MEGRLQGKVAVVTGAASSIGLASTEAFLSSGARVVLVDRDDAAVTSICKKHGDAAIPLVLDLLDSTACSTLVPRGALQSASTPRAHCPTLLPAFWFDLVPVRAGASFIHFPASN